LILYNGQQAGGSGDFISLGLNNGFPEFRFDVGAGPAVIKSDKAIELGRWHTVKLSRNKKDGTMMVDDTDGPFYGSVGGRFLGLDLLEPLYLGGVPNFRSIHKLSGFSRGMVALLILASTEVFVKRPTRSKDTPAFARLDSLDTIAIKSVRLAIQAPAGVAAVAST